MSEWRVLGYVIEEKIKKGKFHIVHVTFPLGLGYMVHRDQSLFGEKKKWIYHQILLCTSTWVSTNETEYKADIHGLRF